MENQNGFGKSADAKVECCLPECCEEVRETKSEIGRLKDAVRDFLAALDRKVGDRDCRCACC